MNSGEITKKYEKKRIVTEMKISHSVSFFHSED